MSAPTVFHEWRLLAGLDAFADAEEQGRQLNKNELTAAVGSFTGSDGRKFRDALVARGWLTILDPGGSNSPAKTRVTAQGWERLGRPQPKPNSRGPRTRKCLKCTKPFPSEGAHNQMCGHCRLHPERDIAF